MLSTVARAAAIAMICGYKVGIRPLLVGSCRHYPTCSDYGIESIRVHGLLRGGALTARRLLRCHPFAPGGIDPVPPARSRAE